MKTTLSLIISAGLFFLLIKPSFAAVPDLVGRWSLNDNSNNIAKDTSGNGLDGTVTGTLLTGGLYGNAYSFDTDNDLVTIKNNQALEPANVTVESWVKADASPGSLKYVVAKGAQADFAASYGLYTGDNGGLEFYISKGSAFMSSPNPGTGIWDGQWHHIAGTFDGSIVRLYVDGKEVDNGTPAPSFYIKYHLTDSNSLLIGGYAIHPDTHNFIGSIDEVRIWDRALTPSEVNQHASANSVALVHTTLFSLPSN